MKRNLYWKQLQHRRTIEIWQRHTGVACLMFLGIMANENPTLPSNDDPEEVPASTEDGTAMEVAKEEIPSPPPTPDTKTPIQFNQQINVQNIPPSAWGILNSEQILELSKAIIHQTDVIDERHYKFAMDRANRDSTGKKWAMSIGGVITVAGFAITAYLADSGNTLAAVSISLPLATILAIVVGNRFLG